MAKVFLRAIARFGMRGARKLRVFRKRRWNRAMGRRELAAAVAMAVLCGVPVGAVGVRDVHDAIRQADAYAQEASESDVMSAYRGTDEPGRLYLTSGAADGTADDGSNGDGSSQDAVTGGSQDATRSSHVPAGAVALPWKIHVDFTLDGPDVAASRISGASGVVGIHVRLTSTNHDATSELVPVVAFTIPVRVGDDVSSSDGAIVSSDNTRTLVAAIGGTGDDIDFTTYVTARKFTMSALAIAAVSASADGDAGSAGGVADGTVDDVAGNNAAINGFKRNLAGLTHRASTLVDGLTNVGSQRNQTLIRQLETLRDHEKELAKQTIAARSETHRQAFDAYIDAYVDSYTTHLSGSLGDTTQLSAILGTASELNGDTDVAHAVVTLANAVNDVSAAYRHEGAADAVDEVIRTIEQRGTSDLLAELNRRSGEERQRGSKDYSAGQSRLSAAMIPYSMDFTDAYTARLRQLGASSSTARDVEARAIADVRSGIGTNEKLKAARNKVDAAMDDLAAASEHTGQASAFHQIAIRFADQFGADADADGSMNADSADDGSGDADSAGGSSADGGLDDDGSAKGASADGGSAKRTARRNGSRTRHSDVSSAIIARQSESSLASGTEKARLKRQRKAELRQAKAARERDATADSSSLVDDSNAISMGDVMSYAGGLRSSFGAAADTTSKNMAKVGGVTSDSAKRSGDSGKSGKSVDSAETSLPIGAYGLAGSGDRSSIVPDNSDMIDETVGLADAAETLDAVLQQDVDSVLRNRIADSARRHARSTQYVLSVPVL